MAAANTDKFKKAKRRFSTTIGVGGIAAGATTLPLTSTTGLDTDTAVTLVIEPGTVDEEVITGVVSGNNLINCVRGKEGTNDIVHNAGDSVSMYFTETHWDDLINGILVSHNQDGTLANNAITTASITNASVTQAKLDTNLQQGWIDLADTPDTITYNGNRSYDVVYNSTDLSSTLSPGMRMKLTRTVAAPYRCTDLEKDSSQYYSKSSPAGMTFTDDFVVSAWIKLESYGTQMTIASRYNGTSGWDFNINTNGQVKLSGFNNSASNESTVISNPSVPLNRWVHVAAQLDMSAFTATTTTSYTMIDGLDVPSSVSRAGTNPTALIQAGNLEIGGRNGGLLPFDGEIAQVAIYSAKVTQANVRATISQSLTGSETSIISAYSFDNSINDLNTTNANNLTANGSAVATDTDSPFADAVSAGLQEYAIITKVAYSTNTTVTVQVPEGCAIPTSGGISASYYSMQRSPFGMPVSTDRWMITSVNRAGGNSSVATATWANISSQNITVPVGSWNLAYKVTIYVGSGGGAGIGMNTTLSTATNTESNGKFTIRSETPGNTTQGPSNAHTLYPEPLTVSSATVYYLNSSHTVGSTQPLYNFGERNGGTVINAYLGLL
jgi:hypothetical protein